MTDKVLSAVQDLYAAVREEDGEDANFFVTSALVLLTFVDDDGKFVTYLKDDDIRTWEAKGLLKDLLDDLAAVNIHDT